MPNAAAAVLDYVLPYAGCSTVARLATGTSARILADLNGALQDLYAGEKTEWRTAMLRGPTAVTLGQVTQGSTGITFADGAPWMAGCTIRISGDFRENRVTYRSGSVGLENPYLGTTASNVTATVYGDCVTADIDVVKVLEPVSIDKKWPVLLVGLAKIEAMMIGRDVKPSQRPLYAALEDALTSNGPPGIRIFLDSLPLEAGLLRFRAVARAPVVTSWSDTREFLLPAGLDASVLMPLVLWKFSTHPDFTGDAAQVATAAKVALEAWSQTKTLGTERRQVSMMD